MQCDQYILKMYDANKHYFLYPERNPELVSALEFLPTISSLVGIDTSHLLLDGLDMSELLLGINATVRRRGGGLKSSVTGDGTSLDRENLNTATSFGIGNELSIFLITLIKP